MRCSLKKIVCGCFGTIYYAQVLKNGLMPDSNRENVTDDALLAVLQHIMSMKEYEERDGFSGYEYKIGDRCINLVAYDKSKYKLIKNDDGESCDGKA